MMEEVRYLEPGEFWTCPNCEGDTYDSEMDGGGHTPDSYSYFCENCGCRYGVQLDEVQHGLNGWRLSIEEDGNPRKNPDWKGHLEGKWLSLYDDMEDVEEVWGKE